GLLSGSAFKLPQELTGVALDVFQLGSLLLAVRMLDLTLGSTLRGCERFDLAARVTMSIRCVTTLAAVLLVQQGFGVGAMVVATIAGALGGVLAQGILVHQVIGVSPWVPAWNGAQLREMFGFGVYAWLLGIGGLIFGQTDRLAVGTMLGVAALG